MRNKHKKKLLSLLFGYLFLLGQMAVPGNVFAAASGNYTDLLPIGAASDTTVISRGSGWALATLPTSQTFGDSLSRLNYTAYQATSTVTIGNSTTVSTFTAQSGQGYVGSTTFPSSWVASGRSMRVSIKGKYSTTASNWTWALKLGTTTVLTTGALAAVSSQTDQYFNAVGLITIGGTGNTGTVNASFDIYASSGATPNSVVSYSTTTASAVTVDLTTQLTVNPVFNWGTQASGNTLTANNVVVEFLN